MLIVKFLKQIMSSLFEYVNRFERKSSWNSMMDKSVSDFQLGYPFPIDGLGQCNIVQPRRLVLHLSRLHTIHQVSTLNDNIGPPSDQKEDNRRFNF